MCKQDFSDPRLVFKHMNQVHINFPLQQQLQQQQQASAASPPPQLTSQVTVTSHSIPQPQQQQQQSQPQQQVIHHHHHHGSSQQPPPLVPSQSSTTLTTSDNVVYTNISTDNIYYDERTGQYYTIALMDHSPPLAETPGSQSVIEYVHDSSGLGETVEYVTNDGTGETIIIEEEPQPKVVITSGPVTQQVEKLIEPPPPLVQITRDTDLEELIPTTTLVAADEQPSAAQHLKSTKADLKAHQQQQFAIKCANCSASFVKKFPKQMYCHTCVARNTHAKHS